MGIKYQKSILVCLLIFSMLTATACTQAEASDKTTGKSAKPYASAMPDEETIKNLADKSNSSADSIKNSIENIVKNQVAAYSHMSLDSCTVMALQGTETADDYTARCYITSNSSTAASAATEELTAFTRELANRLDAYSGAVGELSIVWTVPSVTGSGRITYKKNNGTLELSAAEFDDNLEVNDGEKQ